MVKLEPNVEELLSKRYYQKVEKSWEDICERVSSYVSSKDKDWKNDFHKAMLIRDFIPSTPCLINAGNINQLSSCFIISIKEDSLSAIFEAVTECGRIFQKNGGVGLNISILRPNNTKILSSTGNSCGTVGFMEIFDLVADVITRNNVRKGALKIDLEVWHPDILDFIKCKFNTDVLKRMNISVAVSDDFMKAVRNNENWELKFPDYKKVKDIYDREWDGDIEKWESKGYPVKIYQTIKARELYKIMMEHAWKTGEPGISHITHMDKENPNPHLGRIRSTNPCSEFNSIPYNSCNLGSINLFNMFDGFELNEEDLKDVVELAVRFIDNMISVNKLPLPKIDKITNLTRPVGMGIMGYADLLYALEIPYNSEEAIKFTHKLLNIIKTKAIETSIKLAEEKGVYPAWKGSTWEQKGIKIRNSNQLSIAPTGSISFIANTSGGLEPNFALVYQRKTNEGDTFFMVNKVFEKKLKELGIYSEELIEKVFNEGIKDIKEIPDKLKKVFVTANDLTPEEHLDILEVFSNYVDLSCSKTINLPYEATVEDVEDIYMQAWERGIKCVTIYRNGSRSEQTLTTGKQQEEKKEKETFIKPKKRPQVTSGKTYMYETGCGKLFITVNTDESGYPFDLFVTTGSKGGCDRMTEGVSRLTSLALRASVDPYEVIDQLTSVGSCPSFQLKRGKGKKLIGKNCADVVGKVLKKVLDEKKDLNYENITQELEKVENIKIVEESVVNDSYTCPECDSELRNESSCIVCSECGWSKCG